MVYHFKLNNKNVLGLVNGNYYALVNGNYKRVSDFQWHKIASKIGGSILGGTNSNKKVAKSFKSFMDLSSMLMDYNKTVIYNCKGKKVSKFCPIIKYYNNYVKMFWWEKLPQPIGKQVAKTGWAKVKYKNIISGAKVDWDWL